MPTREELKLIRKFMKRQLEILNKKGFDYSGEEKTTKNFKFHEDIGIPAEVSCFIRLSDKFNRLKSFFKRKDFKFKEETVEDTLIDLANYCIILYLILKEKKVL